MNSSNNLTLETFTNHSEELLNRLRPNVNKWIDYRITTESNYPTPPPLIEINGESIATAGNIICVSGLQKAGKSSFTGIVLSGAIKQAFEILDGVPDAIKIMPANGKGIIHIDTEQAKHRHLTNLKYGILGRISYTKSPENLLSYNVRGLEIDKCIELLNDVFSYANEAFGGIHLCLIDGIADLILSVNDEESSNQIVKYLDRLATDYNTLIIVVIHRNPSDSKVRGHIGSQLLRKCESVLAIKKDGDSSYIEPEELRTAGKNDIPKYLFQFDKSKGYHVCIGEHTSDAQENKFEFYSGLVYNIFKNELPISTGLILDQLAKMTGKGTSTCKTYLNDMVEYSLIEKESRGQYKKIPPPENDCIDYNEN